jgi:hypothetical protein
MISYDRKLWLQRSILAVLLALPLANIVSAEILTTTRTHKACGAASSTTSAPVASLTPAIHWDIDLYDLDNLQPNNSFTLFYSGQGVPAPGPAQGFLQNFGSRKQSKH